ncbi:MAG: hypothetical protein NT128_04610 [Proteobacteria bacterium]|nr:hypothetical protein [Pseudomonadota bacterium]
MTFNKKLLALAIAHFAFAQFVFAMDGVEDGKEGSRIAKAAGKLVESGFERLNKRVNLDEAVVKGSAACQGCGRGLLTFTRGTTTVALGLLDRVDVLLSGRITTTKGVISGYEKQAVSYVQSKNYNTIVSAYQWLKENTLYVMFEKLD